MLIVCIQKIGWYRDDSSSLGGMGVFVLNHVEQEERNMKEKLQAIRDEAISKLEAAKDLESLNEIKVAILGKKGDLTQVLKGMKDVAPEDRPKVGQLVNDTRTAIEEKMETVRKDILKKIREEKMEEEYDELGE